MNNKKMIAFFATWCSFCQSMQPDFYEFKQENPEIEIEVFDVDIDREKAIFFRAVSVPTMIMVGDDKEYCRMTSPRNKKELLDFYNHECKEG
jgi:thiol-disulfide isomerase/thioredoxin